MQTQAGLEQLGRDIEQILTERTTHVVDSINDVMVNQLFTLNTHTTATFAFYQQFNRVSTIRDARIRSNARG